VDKDIGKHCLETAKTTEDLIEGLASDLDEYDDSSYLGGIARAARILISHIERTLARWMLLGRGKDED